MSALPPPARRGLTAALFAVVFASGALVGASTALVVVRRTARAAVKHPDIRTGSAARWLARRLSLDGSQQDRVRAILEAQAAELAGLRREVWPRVLVRLDVTEREVDAQLTSEQRAKWKKLADRLRRNWLDGHQPPAAR